MTTGTPGPDATPDLTAQLAAGYQPTNPLDAAYHPEYRVAPDQGSSETPATLDDVLEGPEAQPAVIQEPDEATEDARFANPAANQQMATGTTVLGSFPNQAA